MRIRRKENPADQTPVRQNPHFVAQLDLTQAAPVVLIRCDELPTFFRREGYSGIATAQTLVCWD